MKLKKIKKNVAKLPIEKQIKLLSWLERYIQESANKPGSPETTTESL